MDNQGSQEMTLEQWVERLPPDHSARVEYKELMGRAGTIEEYEARINEAKLAGACRGLATIRLIILGLETEVLEHQAVPDTFADETSP